MKNREKIFKKAKEKIKYWGQLILLPVYGFSFLFPRSKKIWLFGSTFGRRFADNPRYLYLYLSQMYRGRIQPVWISRNKQVVELLAANGYQAYYYHSLQGIWYCLRGKIYIFDNYSKDISFWLSGGAVKFKLWHGTGNKRANHDNEFDKVRHPKNLWERFLTFPRRLSDEKPHHYTLATSEPLAVITSSAFNTSLEHVIIDGYPRMDAVLDDEFKNLLTEKESISLKDIKQRKLEGKIIDFYMPTFRDSEKKFFEIMDLDRFNSFLESNHIVFVIKLHPKSKLKEEFAAIHYSNIYSVDAEVDPYVFLKYVDVLTVDYSSIYSEYMLLDRPVVSFFYDYDDYTANTRLGYVSFDKYMPEMRAYNMEELMSATMVVLKEDIHKTDRIQSRNRMWKYQNKGSCERLTKQIMKLLNF